MTKQRDFRMKQSFWKTALILSLSVIGTMLIMYFVTDILIRGILVVVLLGAALFILKLMSKGNGTYVTEDTEVLTEVTETDDLQERLKQIAVSAEGIIKDGYTKQLPVIANDDIGKIAEAFNYLLDHIKGFVKELDDLSEESSDTSRNLADITERTSCVMEEVTATLEELTSNTVQLNGSIEGIADGAKEVENLTSLGIASLQELDHKMTHIVQEADQATLSIQELNKASEKMKGIIDVISGIAKQTNLLALNAAIEAARAGEMGKGFAVVADEVRILAGNTQESLENISDLISSFSYETSKTVQLIDSNNKDIVEGGAILKETSNTFNVIAENISHMVEGINKSVSASSQIASGSQEIASATGVQTNAMSEIADMSQKLSNMSTQLKSTLADTQIGGADIQFDLAGYDQNLSLISPSQKTDLKQSIGVDQKFVIGMIARLEPIKGYEFFIRGMKALLNQYSNAICIIVGDGSLEQSLKEQVRRENLGDSIKFLGYRKDIQKLLSIMDVVVLTSQKEGMPPQILVEAMASSKPVVATNVKGNKILVKHNKTGLLVDYNDTMSLSKSIEMFIQDPNKGVDYGQAGRKRLEDLMG
ncbi:glycosyltransferase [Vallitalea pronyensis]|uniref:Glycosyltransferase n=1 Tax=Vallitalea pronyensis TaxID=1348613 RepID=A0A8J8MJ86_9FIRM|nr:methyl-accepting chemotaxis protein [Vallitalea pronyensis]QUI22659.1 glycosyltransferase [Vallitalea pronyensis]